MRALDELRANDDGEARRWHRWCSEDRTELTVLAGRLPVGTSASTRLLVGIDSHLAIFRLLSVAIIRVGR